MPSNKKDRLPRPSLKADITPELDELVDKAVATLRLRGEKIDRSKFIRDAVERRLRELEPIIANAEAGANK